MTLSAKCIERLTILADYMDGLNDPRFTMKLVNHECGAPACAWGHAKRVFGAELPTYPAFMDEPDYFFVHDLSAFFELFGAKKDKTIHTPQQWAAHCRAFLKEHGAQVAAPTSDKFTAFMGRVLAPVEVEA